MRRLAACVGAVAVLSFPAAALAASGSLVYSDGDGALYVSSLQGSGPTNLFQPDRSTALEALAVSPDGKQILAYDDGDTEQLVLVPFGGGAPVAVAGTDGADAGCFSPDGTQVLFSIGDTSTSELSPGLYTVPLAGGTPKPVLTSPSDASDSLPKYSPDGTTIAFARDSIDANGNRVVTLELVPAAGGTPKSLATGLARDLYDGGQLSFSPDGKTIAYAGDYDNPGIYVVPIGGGTPSQLTTDFDFWPVYSPDGSTILFSRDATSDNAVTSSSSDFYELWSMKPDGTGAANLAQGDFENLVVQAPIATGAPGAPATPATTTTTTTTATTTTTTTTAHATPTTTKGKSRATAVKVRVRRPRYTVRWRGRAPTWKVTLKVGHRIVTARVKGAVHSHTFVLRGSKGSVSAHVVAR